MYVSLSMERFSIKAQLSNIFGLLSYTTMLQLQNLYIISTTVYHYGRFVHSSPYVIDLHVFCLCVPKALSLSERLFVSFFSFNKSAMFVPLN